MWEAKKALFLSWLRRKFKKVKWERERNKKQWRKLKEGLEEIWWASIYKSWEREKERERERERGEQIKVHARWWFSFSIGSWSWWKPKDNERVGGPSLPVPTGSHTPESFWRLDLLTNSLSYASCWYYITWIHVIPH